jgi:phage gp29-like protein
MPQLKFDIEEAEDIKLFSEALPALANAGMRIPTAWAHQKLSIPLPENDEPVLGAQAPVVPAKEKAAALTRAIASLKAELPEQDIADQLAAQLRAKAAPVMGKLLKPIEELVANATSLEDLLQQLLTLEGKLDESELAEVMQLALSAAEMGGRFDVAVGN